MLLNDSSGVDKQSCIDEHRAALERVTDAATDPAAAPEVAGAPRLADLRLGDGAPRRARQRSGGDPPVAGPMPRPSSRDLAFWSGYAPATIRRWPICGHRPADRA